MHDTPNAPDPAQAGSGTQPKPRERGPFDAMFERGVICDDSPPGWMDREYAAWKAAGGKVLAQPAPILEDATPHMERYLSLLGLYYQLRGAAQFAVGYLSSWAAQEDGSEDDCKVILERLEGALKNLPE